ncbi:DsbA family protein [Patulibacter sp. NPDC049589]|uniref:DsbA family oxidoreductase n=1 Tax=Patulibacter sp. NPDC049589 TaxID=3154731 RepID=UPI00343DD6CD
MTRPRITVWFDYVCPYCLLAAPAIDAVADEFGLTVELRPFELRRRPAPTLRPEDPYLPAVWAGSVLPLAERLGIPISLPTISPQPYSDSAFAGLFHAERDGRGAAWTRAVLRAFFQEDRDIGDHAVLADIATRIGLDGDELGSALADGRHRGAHERALADADRRGVRAVPTVEVGGQRIEGAPDREHLARLVSRALATPDPVAAESLPPTPRRKQ